MYNISVQQILFSPVLMHLHPYKKEETMDDNVLKNTMFSVGVSGISHKTLAHTQTPQKIIDKAHSVNELKRFDEHTR